MIDDQIFLQPYRVSQRKQSFPSAILTIKYGVTQSFSLESKHTKVTIIGRGIGMDTEGRDPVLISVTIPTFGRGGSEGS